MIKCNNCGKYRSEDDFYKRNNGKIRRPCKYCEEEYREKHRAEYRERAKERNARWNDIVSPEKRAEYHHRSYEKQKSKWLLQKFFWRLFHRDKDCERVGKRRAQKYKTQIAVIDRANIFQRDGGICHICHKPVDPNNWHLDHVKPLSRGGKHTPDNVAVSHPICNQRKGYRA